MSPARRHWSDITGSRVTILLLGVALYSAAYSVVTWPWALRMWNHAPAGADEGMLVWGFSWMRQAVEHAQWPFTTTHVLAPHGTTLAVHTGMPLLALISVPIQWLLGPYVAYNLTVLVVVILIGLCTYALARDFGLGASAAYFAGLAYAVAPPVTLRYGTGGHLSFGAVFWIPLALLQTRRLTRVPSIHQGLLLGAVLAGAALTDITIALYTSGVILAYLIGWASRSGLRRSPELATAIGAAAATLLVLTSPLLIAVVCAIRSQLLGTVPGFAGSWIYSADILGFLIPNPTHPIAGSTASRIGVQFVTDGESAYVGVTLLCLAVIGFVRRNSPIARWLAALAGLSIVLSLGPTLRVAGHHFTPLPVWLGGHDFPVSALMPYTWLQSLPGLSHLRNPVRMLLVAALPLALLAGMGIEVLIGSRRHWRWPLTLGLAMALVVEGLSPVIAYQRTDLPPAYQVIASDVDESAIVVDVPLGFRTGFHQIGLQTGSSLLYAAGHEKPVATGMVARLNERRLTDLASIPLYRDLITLQSHSWNEPVAVSPSEGRQSAFAYNLKYVVVRKDIAGLGAVRTYLHAARYDRLLVDETVELYRLRPEYP